MADPQLFPCFLGPYGENDDFLERLIVAFFRDHVYWRRNLHPEDPPAIPTAAVHRPDFMAFESRLRRELHQLSAGLKRSVPFHSQRYLGHMVSDLLIPGLAAYMLALPYNQNNVSEEAAPVTLDLEIEAGLQLARMVGYPTDTASTPCAFGHLTSGGSVANYQGLRLALAIKAFPVALLASGAPCEGLPASTVQAFNLPQPEAIALYVRYRSWLDTLPRNEAARWRRRVEAERLERLGLHGFFAAHPELTVPVVLAPATAHYSWSKAVKLLGLGRAHLLRVAEREMRLDVDALRGLLAHLQESGQSVLACVGVLGSTEFGTIDPIDEMAALREEFGRAGLGFALHVDAAWGGYVTSLFRDEQGALRPCAAVAREFERFPEERVYRAFAALSAADSITIDPHKLGHLPYGAGAFVARDHRALPLLAEEAAYVFHGDAGREETDREGRGRDGMDGEVAESDSLSAYRRQMRGLGRYIIEGSKSGAMAAAVCLTHRVLPLDHAHFGRIIASTIRSTEAFRRAFDAFAQRMASRVTACVPFEPDCNLVCIALNPTGNTQLDAANDLADRLYRSMSTASEARGARCAYYVSRTTLSVDALGAEPFTALLARLGLAAVPVEDAEETGLVVLRHTLMNPFLSDEKNGVDYIEGYFAHLEALIRAFVSE